MYPDGSRAFTAVINFSSSSTNVIVAGVAGARINIMKLMLVTGGTTNLTFEDGLTPMTGAMAVLEMALDYDGNPWFTTSVGNGFAILSSNAVQVSGSLQYQLVPG